MTVLLREELSQKRQLQKENTILLKAAIRIIRQFATNIGQKRILSKKEKRKRREEKRVREKTSRKRCRKEKGGKLTNGKFARESRDGTHFCSVHEKLSAEFIGKKLAAVESARYRSSFNILSFMYLFASSMHQLCCILQRDTSKIV